MQANNSFGFFLDSDDQRKSELLKKVQQTKNSYSVDICRIRDS